ncbi:MAN2A2_4 [Blepharisma stoltei]|uniref:Glycoside hydrolase family 38 central domain-containing protein n=1 Tax=Blepharisma stoltei TaxID=1481888 RepID=A0AAU9JIZ6_9CILI|nr:unnamed protein product [Blepharisma stoltei]
MIIFYLIQVLAEGLELYLIPHSHCDSGWLETFDKYYELKVKNILRNVVTLLEEDENRRFSWSEISFLKVWMENEDKKITNKFNELVAKGRIEIVGGEYVQNDEANTDFDMIIRQIELGHQFLHKEFGIERVKTGWQIDIFGHSALTPGIYSRFGYEFLVITRINEVFRSQLRETRGMEFIWKGVDFGSSESIFTHVLYDFYYAPLLLRTEFIGPCFGRPKHLEADIRECVAMLCSMCKDWSQGYRNKKIMMVYGGDFFYDNITEARILFERIEQLVDWQRDSGLYKQLKIKFATPSEYFEDIKKSNKKYPVYTGDFFPYQSYRLNIPAYWTGYYSTRPSLKQLINKAHRLARAAEIAKALIHGEEFAAYNASLALHHDAITGASKPWVAEDYEIRLESDCEKAYQAICETISSVFAKTKSSFSLALPYKVLILYNSINWDKTDLITIDSGVQHLEIKNWRGESIESQYISNHDKTAYVIYLKLTLPALSFVTLFITEHATSCKLCSTPFILKENGSIISDQYYSIEFDSHGYAKSIKNSHKKYELIQEFWSYPADRAGAYLFEPTSEGNPISDLNLESFEIWQGSVANIVEVKWKRIKEKNTNYDHYYKKIILYREKRFIWKYGLYAAENKEILVRFKSKDIAASDWFYTSNSGDLRIRKYLNSKEYSDKYNTKTKKPLIPEEKGENMYPVPGGFAINMGKEAFKIFPKFSLGVGIVSHTSFEILMHRNAPLDDSLGLGEGVDDKTFTDYILWLN